MITKSVTSNNLKTSRNKFLIKLLLNTKIFCTIFENISSSDEFSTKLKPFINLFKNADAYLLTFFFWLVYLVKFHY